MPPPMMATPIGADTAIVIESEDELIQYEMDGN
jgi:hypothetical protein